MSALWWEELGLEPDNDIMCFFYYSFYNRICFPPGMKQKHVLFQLNLAFWLCKPTSNYDFYLLEMFHLLDKMKLSQNEVKRPLGKCERNSINLIFAIIKKSHSPPIHIPNFILALIFIVNSYRNMDQWTVRVYEMVAWRPESRYTFIHRKNSYFTTFFHWLNMNISVSESDTQSVCP